VHSDTNPLLLSVVIPTLGRRELLETIEQLTTLPLCQNEYEIILGGNGPDSHDFLDKAQEVFGSKFENFHFQKFSEFVLTAEENALRSMRLAKGNHIWLLGDDDLLLRNGLLQVSKYAKLNCAGVFFNYKQMTSAAQVLPNPPFISMGASRELSFADLVSRLGIQSVPTGFGRFLIRRNLIDFDEWQVIIDKTSALFSHVLAFSLFLNNETIIWDQTPIVAYRQSSYHEGSNSTWKNYGKLKDVPWMTPFCGELAAQIRYLVENNIWSKHQAEFAMFNERENTIYQADYLLQQIILQIREAKLDITENLRDIDFNNLNWYYLHIAPSRLASYRKLETFSRNLNSTKRSSSLRELEDIERSMVHNSQDGLFSGGIAYWLDGYPVFGLPYGLVQIRTSVSERPLVIRIFELDEIESGSNFTFFKSSDAIALHNHNYEDTFFNSQIFAERSSWNVNSGVIEFHSIPRIYAWPSLLMMRLIRTAPTGIRKFFRNALIKRK
jgi:hypothetical protein